LHDIGAYRRLAVALYRLAENLMVSCEVERLDIMSGEATRQAKQLFRHTEAGQQWFTRRKSRLR
jgi:hypothetical protein